MTARTTCPFLMFPSGTASFTEAVITSPIRPTRFTERPRGWIQLMRRAPELSATSRMVRIWIMARLALLALHPLGAGDDGSYRPALASTHGTGLRDYHPVSHPTLVLLVVGHEARRAFGVTTVSGIPDDPLHLHDDRLGHLVTDDDSFQALASSSRRYRSARRLRIGHQTSLTF